MGQTVKSDVAIRDRLGDGLGLMSILSRYPEPFGRTRKRGCDIVMDQTKPDGKKPHVGSGTYDKRESIRHPIIKPCDHMRIQGWNVSFEKKIIETLRPPTINVHRLLRHCSA